MLDLPLLRGDEPPYAGYVAAAQNPWPGAIAFYRSPESSSFLLKAVAPAPATTGVTLDPLPAGATSRYDRASTIRVQLDQGALASATELALLGGANTAAIENADGDWEVLQFQSAVLVATSTYQLSLFLRGQAGTEAAMRSPLAAGARFVLLDGAVTAVDMAPGEIGLAYTWRCGPANRDLGNPSYLETTHAFTGEGLRPLSPAHVRAARSAGDLAISWVRRTRIGGDSWDAVEVPLAEETERYEIDILDGTTVKRTLASTTPAATYTAADQTADFGAPQPSISLRVYQLSTVFGRGSARARDAVGCHPGISRERNMRDPAAHARPSAQHLGPGSHATRTLTSAIRHSRLTTHHSPLTTLPWTNPAGSSWPGPTSASPRLPAPPTIRASCATTPTPATPR